MIVTDKELQTIRLMIMMYRQGWLDALELMHKETMKMSLQMFKQYKELVPKE